jgi:hypothetical protein
MTFDEFSNKLKEIKAEFTRIKGRDMSPIAELEQYLIERKNRRLSKGLKSLKGFDI